MTTISIPFSFIYILRVFSTVGLRHRYELLNRIKIEKQLLVLLFRNCPCITEGYIYLNQTNSHYSFDELFPNPHHPSAINS